MTDREGGEGRSRRLMGAEHGPPCLRNLEWCCEQDCGRRPEGGAAADGERREGEAEGG